MQHFVDNDAGYLDWLNGHQDGFVVNTYRHPSPGYLKLHLATCPTITRMQPFGKTWTAHEYSKVCANSRIDLDNWARQTLRGQLDPCGICNP